MAKRAPKIRMYWSWPHGEDEPKVNWRLEGGNGEVMCSSTQGYRDKVDCVRDTTERIAALSTKDKP